MTPANPGCRVREIHADSELLAVKDRRLARLACVVAIFLTLLSCVCPSAAAEPEGAGGKSDTESLSPSERFPPAWEPALRTTGADALYLLTSPLRLTTEKALIVGAIGAGIAGLSLADREIRDAARHRREDSLDEAASAVSLLGSAPVLFGLNVGAIVVGEGIREYSGNPKHLDSALVAAESQLLTLAFSEGIAHATARSRPRDSSDPFRFKFRSPDIAPAGIVRFSRFNRSQ